MFDSNKISLNQINICLNQINFSPKQRNECIDIWSKILFVWFKAEIYLVQRYFVSFKQNISSHQRKCFKQIIFLIRSNIFFACVCYYSDPKFIEFLFIFRYFGIKSDSLYFLRILSESESVKIYWLSVKFDWFK